MKKQNRIIKPFRTLFVLIILLPAVMIVQGQKENDISAFSEFTKFKDVYNDLPVQLTIDVSGSANPVTEPGDTARTKLNLFYGLHNFYMEAEGLEEIINDSLIIIVNNPARLIQIYPNTMTVKEAIGKSMSEFMADTNVLRGQNHFSGKITEPSKGLKQISLVSNATVSGTSLPGEILSVTYHGSSNEPVEFVKSRTRLLPVDSVVYTTLVQQKEYNGRLFRKEGQEGEYYFLAKEISTSYHFIKITHKVGRAPVLQEDRIVLTNEGLYQCAPGFTQYLISKQF